MKATGMATFAMTDAEFRKIPLYVTWLISDAKRSDGVTHNASLDP